MAFGSLQCRQLLHRFHFIIYGNISNAILFNRAEAFIHRVDPLPDSHFTCLILTRSFNTLWFVGCMVLDPFAFPHGKIIQKTTLWFVRC